MLTLDNDFPPNTCPEGQFCFLILSDEEEVVLDGEIIHAPEKWEPENGEEGECQILDFMGFSEVSSPTSPTLKLHGKIKEIPTQVLVDSGASHNFIS